MPQLRVLLGYLQGRVFALHDRSFLIGRDPHADLVLHVESSGSRRHAEIYPAGAGWCIRDLQSANGTELNGAPLKESTLNDGDEIVIGDNVFVFETDDEVVATIAEAASMLIPPISRGITAKAEIQTLVHELATQLREIESAIGQCGAASALALRHTMVLLLAQEHGLLHGIPAALRRFFPSIAAALGLKYAHLTVRAATLTRDLLGEPVGQGALFHNLCVLEDAHLLPGAGQALAVEAMRQGTVTVEGVARPVEQPFLLLAGAAIGEAAKGWDFSLNPALADRFGMTVTIPNARLDIVDGALLTPEQLFYLEHTVRDLPASDFILNSIVRIVRATRPGDPLAPSLVEEYIREGAGPRAAKALVQCSRAHALLAGRLHVESVDVHAVAPWVLAHRLCLTPEARAAGYDGERMAALIVHAAAEAG